MENVWDYLRQNKLCATVWDSYDEIVAACKVARNCLIADPSRILSIGTREWAAVSDQDGWYKASISRITHAKSTRRDAFLAEMEAVVPWAEFQRLIEPFYPKAGNGSL